MRIAILAAAAALMTGPAAAADDANKLSHGMVQMNLQIGKTTQYEVVEAFGGPNVTTIDGAGNEVWVYDRHATVSSTDASNFSIGLGFGGVGSGVGGGLGVGGGKRKAKAEQSTRAMTLIIKFDRDRKVVDFKSRSSSF